jgi:hypothetical protein
VHLAYILQTNIVGLMNPIHNYMWLVNFLEVNKFMFAFDIP